MCGLGRGHRLLFAISKFFIGLYLGQSSMGSAYGPAGSLVLIWYGSTVLVLLFGAEFTAVYAHRHGSRAAGDGPPLPALAGSDEHGSGYVSSTMDTSTVRTQKGKMRP